MLISNNDKESENENITTGVSDDSGTVKRGCS